MEHLTQSKEHYLRTIVTMGGSARVGEVAHKMGVSAASVSTALQDLVKMGYLHHAGDNAYHLTETGEEKASALHRHYKLAFHYFAQVLCLELDQAAAAADALEHVLDDESFATIGESILFFNTVPDLCG